MIITLPWPPSINHYWRRVGARTLISKEGREYRLAVTTHVLSLGLLRHPPMDGSMRVHIVAFMPDRRRRDLDNLLKAPLDALEHAGVYRNDSDIDDLRIVRMHDVENPRLEVTILQGGEMSDEND